MVPINGAEAFDVVCWATGGSDDPNPHQYLFYKDPTANSIRILESRELPGCDDRTTWTYNKDIITPPGTIEFSHTTPIAAASTFGLGYSGSRKAIRVFAHCKDGRIRDYVWYPGSLGWKQGDLSHEVPNIGGKFAAKAYDYAGAACFSLFFQDSHGWVHEARKHGADEWHFQRVGEMSGNNAGLWVRIWQQDGVLNKQVVAQSLAIDAQLRDYNYDPTLCIWSHTAEHLAGIPKHIPETFSGGVTIAGLFVHDDPNNQRVVFNCGDQNITHRMRVNGEWMEGSAHFAIDAKPHTPLSMAYMSKLVESDFQQWMGFYYINKAGNLAQAEYRWQYSRGQWLNGAVIGV